MATRQGFLVIELMVALFLFMVLVYSIMRIQGAIALMHNDIAARSDIIGDLRRAIDGRGVGVQHSPYRRVADRTLPLRSITITKKRARTRCSLETVGWIYE